MCEFISWIEKDGAVLFLTWNDLFTGERGRETREFYQDRHDWVGHGAIRFYYKLLENAGRNRECTDFSTPDNFPAEIVAAIRRGAMMDLAEPPEKLLCDTAWAKYANVCEAAWAKYAKVCEAAWAKYAKVYKAGRAKYAKVCEAGRAEFTNLREAAWAEHVKIRCAALAEYETKCNTTFWNLFSNPKKRSVKWR